MIIAVPVNEPDLDTGVCPSFGRAPHYLLHDSETRQSRFIKNAATDSPGGAGIQAAQALIDQGAGAVLAPRCGENAARVLQAAGVVLYRTAPGSAKDNLSAFAAGELSPLGEISPGLHRHGR